MFDKLGVVTNIWAERMAQGDSFVDLATQFGVHGFAYFEVRDGEYLRQSAFGKLVGQIEMAAKAYEPEQWQQICRAIWNQADGNPPIKQQHGDLFQQVETFISQISSLQLSYAISHSWLSPPVDLDADNAEIQTAKQLAYLLCPHAPRLRLVDPTSPLEIKTDVARSNIDRYYHLSPHTTFAVENAIQPATEILDLIQGTGTVLTYDEANVYQPDGSVKDDLAAFWQQVEMADLTSVHFKQKTEAGVLTEVTDGWVDFSAILQRLHQDGYTGDLLLENTPSDDPLTDAVNSRDYLKRLLTL